MVSSASVALLSKFADLACKYGMRPSEADATIDIIKIDENDHEGHFRLSFSGVSQEKSEEFYRMYDSIGLNKDGDIVTDDFRLLEDAIDRALSLAPRARMR